MNKTEIIIDNRNGMLWDASEICTELSWKTSRVGKPSSLDMTLAGRALFQSGSFAVNNGDVVRVKVDGKGLFYGYVFEIEQGGDDAIKVAAFDQMRYLNETDTYMAVNVKPEQVVLDNAQAAGLRIGKLAETGHTIAKMLEDGQKRIDIVCKALESVMLEKGQLYVLFDDFGSLTLKNVNEMTVDLVLGAGSLVYGYQTKRSIDSDTYNQIKLVQEDRETGGRRAYIGKDSGTIARWGQLQYYKKLDGALNEAQIREMLDNLLTLKNRETRTFSLDAIGHAGVRAGVKVQVTVPEADVDEVFLVEECTHSFSGDSHTMKLEMKVLA